ncbi:hypothetical protein H6G04_21045 [Calothrix membranacea FACHB-236]|nr:hypothetical protein [Calothrix membranacea FACHB-236]
MSSFSESDFLPKSILFPISQPDHNISVVASGVETLWVPVTASPIAFG